MKKPCSRCGTTKPLTDYYLLGTAKDGRRSACKDCMNAAAHAARSNPETRTYRLARRADRREVGRRQGRGAEVGGVTKPCDEFCPFSACHACPWKGGKAPQPEAKETR